MLKPKGTILLISMLTALPVTLMPEEKPNAVVPINIIRRRLTYAAMRSGLYPIFVFFTFNCR